MQLELCLLHEMMTELGAPLQWKLGEIRLVVYPHQWKVNDTSAHLYSLSLFLESHLYVTKRKKKSTAGSSHGIDWLLTVWSNEKLFLCCCNLFPRFFVIWDSPWSYLFIASTEVSRLGSLEQGASTCLLVVELWVGQKKRTRIHRTLVSKGPVTGNLSPSSARA